MKNKNLKKKTDRGAPHEYLNIGPNFLFFIFYYFFFIFCALLERPASRPRVKKNFVVDVIFFFYFLFMRFMRFGFRLRDFPRRRRRRDAIATSFRLQLSKNFLLKRNCFAPRPFEKTKKKANVKKWAAPRKK